MWTSTSTSQISSFFISKSSQGSNNSNHDFDTLLIQVKENHFVEIHFQKFSEYFWIFREPVVYWELFN